MTIVACKIMKRKVLYTFSHTITWHLNVRLSWRIFLKRINIQWICLS